jgi:hypothetical protein
MKFFEELKLIRQVMHDLEEQEPDSQYIEVADDPGRNLADLILLSEKRNSRFRIAGETREFTIITKPDLMPLIFWLVFIFAMPVSSLYRNVWDPVEISLMVVFFFIMIAWYRFSETTWNITVDSYHKQLILKSNNPVAMFLKPEVIIPFSDFSDFSCKSIYSQLKGSSGIYTKVFIHYADHKLPLIWLTKQADLEVEDDYYRAFISNLRKFIKD